MNHDERIDQWVRSRARAEVPDGFADRVMAAASDSERTRTGLALRVLAISLAAAAGAARIAAALAIFSTSCGVFR